MNEPEDLSARHIVLSKQTLIRRVLHYSVTMLISESMEKINDNNNFLSLRFVNRSFSKAVFEIYASCFWCLYHIFLDKISRIEKMSEPERSLAKEIVEPLKQKHLDVISMLDWNCHELRTLGQNYDIHVDILKRMPNLSQFSVGCNSEDTTEPRQIVDYIRENHIMIHVLCFEFNIREHYQRMADVNIEVPIYWPETITILSIYIIMTPKQFASMILPECLKFLKLIVYFKDSKSHENDKDLEDLQHHKLFIPKGLKNLSCLAFLLPYLNLCNVSIQSLAFDLNMLTDSDTSKIVVDQLPSSLIKIVQNYIPRMDMLIYLPQRCMRAMKKLKRLSGVILVPSEYLDEKSQPLEEHTLPESLEILHVINTTSQGKTLSKMEYLITLSVEEGQIDVKKIAPNAKRLDVYDSVTEIVSLGDQLVVLNLSCFRRYNLSTLPSSLKYYGAPYLVFEDNDANKLPEGLLVLYVSAVAIRLSDYGFLPKKLLGLLMDHNVCDKPKGRLPDSLSVLCIMGTNTHGFAILIFGLLH